MPTYEYQCVSCGLKFEKKQSPFTECPQCHGKVHRVIRGGAGVILKNSKNPRTRALSGKCPIEQIGKTWCERQTMRYLPWNKP